MDSSEIARTDPDPAPRRRGRRSGIFAAGAAFGITLAGLGIAGAQTSGDTSTTTTAGAAAPEEHADHRGPDHLAAAAKAIGIPPDELIAALRSGQSIAQVAQSRNVPVQKVIDALVAEARQGLEARITELVNRTGPPGGHGPGGRRPGRHGGPGRHGAIAHHLDAAATAIGITPAELTTALGSGQSIAQVAQSRNVPVQKVIDALVAEARSRLAAKVTAGELTQTQADEKAADLVKRVTDLVNHTGGR
ncbi:MAG: hypothetical protein ACRD1K_17570 [Acidimicrobiales bacterium]